MTQDNYESAAVLAAIDEARHEPNAARRAARIWRLVNQATPHGDAGVVRDFALEHNAIADLDISPQSGPLGRSLNSSWTNPADGLEMVWIPPGPFICGSPPRRPPRRGAAPKPPPNVPGFSLAKHPVTNAQFATFLRETDYTPPAWHIRNDLFLSHWGTKGVPSKLETYPVVRVSYYDALAYCEWSGLTLPTEWLWEKAARGPNGWAYPWGDDRPENWTKLANVANPAKGIRPVGSYPRTRSPYGCQDMLGNISEWCQSTPKDQPDSLPSPLPDRTPPKKPEAWEYAPLRGACYLRLAPRCLLSSHRRQLSRMRRNAWVGFRPACLLPYRPVVDDSNA